MLNSRTTATMIVAAPVLVLFLLGVGSLAELQKAKMPVLHQHSKRFSGLYTAPYFDTSTATNITAQLGTHAYLPCRIKQLGNQSVSWIRGRDAHILTVDRNTFIADDRFQAFLVEATDTWTLQIKYVQPRDAGQYECQVSTENRMSHFISLHVVECTPGETKQLECNSCFCSQAGIWGCTQKGCETFQLEVTTGEQATRVRWSEGHCVPNTTYTKESSICTCSSDGSRARCMSGSTRAASISTLVVAMSCFMVLLWNLQILP